jgi:hypothetical protein
MSSIALKLDLFHSCVLWIVPDLLHSQQAYPVVPGFGVAWTTMVHSDHFKPMGQCATMGISYEDVLDSAIALHPRMDTGSSRFFNWIDYDGSATKRGRPTLLGGWPSWWKVRDLFHYK